MIVPTLCVGMPQRTLRVRFWQGRGAPGLYSHAERGNDRRQRVRVKRLTSAPGSNADEVLRWL